MPTHCGRWLLKGDTWEDRGLWMIMATVFVPNKSIVWNVRQCLRNLLIKISEDAAHLSQVMSLFVIGEHLLDNSCEILPELLYQFLEILLGGRRNSKECCRKKWVRANYPKYPVSSLHTGSGQCLMTVITLAVSHFWWTYD